MLCFFFVLCSFSGSDFRPFHRVLAGLSTSSSGMRNLSPQQQSQLPITLLQRAWAPCGEISRDSRSQQCQSLKRERTRSGSLRNPTKASLFFSLLGYYRAVVSHPDLPRPSGSGYSYTVGSIEYSSEIKSRRLLSLLMLLTERLEQDEKLQF